MIHLQIDATLRDAGAEMYDPSSHAGVTIWGWCVGPGERLHDDAVVEWVTRVGAQHEDGLIPTIAPATQFRLVCKTLASLGYGWQLQTRHSRGECTRLHLRPANTALGERIVEHVVRRLHGMQRAPMACGSREARELLCIELLTARHMVSGQEALIDDVMPAWIRAMNKVRKQVLSCPLHVSYEKQPESEFMDALMTAVGHAKRRLPLLDAQLRKFEQYIEAQLADESNGHVRVQLQPEDGGVDEEDGDGVCWT